MIQGVTIRAERPPDHARVHAINRAAFDQDDEAALVERIRGLEPSLSIVATREAEIVGHAFFSPVTIADSDATAMALGPLAVDPAHQRLGVGSALTRHGLEWCRREGHPVVFVLGHPEYYPRFGFREAHPAGLWFGEDAPSPAFMLLELEPGAARGMRGEVRYHRAFDELA